MIDIQSLGVRRSERQVFSNFSVYLAASEHAALVGRSGSGKTTLLAIIAGLTRAAQGSVLIDGLDFTLLPQRRIDQWRATRLGFVPQSAHLLEAISCLDNILLPGQLAGLSQNRARAFSLLETLGLSQKAKLKPRQLSRGEQQRVAIARALMNKPALLLADEPTANLDDDHASSVISLLKDQAKLSGATLFIATHDQRVKASFDKVISLEAGSSV